MQSASSEFPLVGRTFSRYHILEKIGQGGMGEVYLAKDTTLGRRVALKFLPEEAQACPTSRRRFFQEARAAAAIDHPYICKVFDVGEIEGKAFIEMEYLEGQTLSQRLSRGSLEIREAVKTATEVCEALSKAHKNGILHRDLKPANIMCMSDGHTKVMDFGLAKLVESEAASVMTRVGTLTGTPGYMSPEQARGEELDARSDLFALGVVLYEMLTGSNPFLKNQAVATMLSIVKDDPSPIENYRRDCPRPLQDIVLKLLAKDASLRFESCAEALNALNRVFEHPTLAGGPGDLEATFVDLPSVTVSSASALLPRGRPEGVAILPFVNMSSEKENEYFSDGITEEVISRLCKVSRLRVISRTSVMRFKNTDKDLKAIGHELGVESILEGSVRTAGRRVRIATHLVDVATDKQIWGDVFDRDMEDIFAVQSEVARQISMALEASVSQSHDIAESRKPEDLEGYHFYLKGRFFLHKLTPQAVRKAIGFFQKSLESNPLDALTYSGLSTCYLCSGHFGYVPQAEAFPKAKAAAQRALELDKGLAEAHASIAFVKYFHDWDWEGAEREFNKATALDPNYAEAHTYYSWLLVTLKRLEEGLQHGLEALRIDPLSPVTNTNVAWILLESERYEEALEQFDRTIDLDPGNVHARSLRAITLACMGRHEESVRILEEWAWARPMVGWGYAASGAEEKARTILQEVTSPSGKATHSSALIAVLCILLGEEQEGLKWLEEAIRVRDTQVLAIASNPLVSRQLSGSCYQQVARQHGLPL